MNVFPQTVFIFGLFVCLFFLLLLSLFNVANVLPIKWKRNKSRLRQEIHHSEHLVCFISVKVMLLSCSNAAISRDCCFGKLFMINVGNCELIPKLEWVQIYNVGIH